MTNTVCKHLDEITGMECAFQGPYKLSRNKPSLARLCHGDSQGFGFLAVNVAFLMCGPANDLGLEPDCDKLAELQSHCTRYYKERE